MAKGYEVMTMLLPNGGWVIAGNDFESIVYDEGVTPLTKKQFDDAIKTVDAWLAQQEANRVAQKTALLEKLGITENEAKLLLG
jgi:hypothetical protein